MTGLLPLPESGGNDQYEATQTTGRGATPQPSIKAVTRLGYKLFVPVVIE